METKNDEKLYTLGEAAEIVGVNPETLRRWDRTGKLKALRVGSRHGIGDRRYRLKDLEEVMSKKQESPRLGGIKEKLENKVNPVVFSDKRKKVWKYLKDLNNGAGDAYYGAIKTYQDISNPDRIAQCAHSLRELTNLLLSPTRKKSSEFSIEQIKLELETGSLSIDELFEKYFIDGQNSSANINRIKQELSKSGLAEQAALGSARAWVTSHNWFVEVAHHSYSPSEAEFEHHLNLLEDNLLAYTGEFYDAIDKIDKILEKKTPNNDDLIKLKSLIKRGSHYRYFFNKLNNPKWLPLLESDKTFNFKYPPKEIEEANGTIRFPQWIELQYLVRIADRVPEDVTRIILNTESTSNPWVARDYLDAILKMPSGNFKKLLRKIKRERWFYEPYRTALPQLGIDLAEKLILEGAIDSALALATILLSVQKVEKEDFITRKKNGIRTYEVRSYIGDWDYKEFVEKIIPKLSVLEPTKTIVLLRDILESSIHIERDKSGYDDDNLLYFRIPSIESIGRDDPKNLLVVGIRNSLDRLADSNHPELKAVLKILAHSEGIYPIMLRIQMYIYRKYPEIFSEEIKEVLTNPKLFDDIRIDNEYFGLLKTCYPMLDQKSQDLILGWVEKGPTDRAINKSAWQAQKLLPISSFLSKEWLDHYKKITENYTPEPPRHGVTVGSWVGPTSPVEKTTLESMGDVEFLDYLESWKPDDQEMFSPSHEGLGREIEKIIPKDVNRYIVLGEQMFQRKLHPVYLYSLIKGTRDAYTNGETIDWDTILNLCNLLVQKLEPYEFEKFRSIFGTNWNSVRRIIADFIEDILNKGHNDAPADKKEIIWSIISKLVEDPEPDNSFEGEYGGNNMDPATMSINTVRGNALHALIKYALWVNRKDNPKGDNPVLPPEVKAVLEKHLNVEKDSTLTTRSIYGQYFPTIFYLDKVWAKRNIKKIFGPPLDPIKESAWETYLGFGTYWIPVVKALEEQYLESVRSLNPSSSRDRYEDRLAEHLMIAYWRGEIGIDDEVLNIFFENACDGTRNHAIWFLWRSMEENKLKEDSVEWKRLRSLWEKRVSFEPTGEKYLEFSGFADWLSCAPENIKGLYPLIKKIIPFLERNIDVGYLISYLTKNVNVDIDLVSELLFYTVEGNTEEIKYRLHDKEIYEILKACVQSGSTKAKEYAQKTIHLFGDQGNDGFRDLLTTN